MPINPLSDKFTKWSNTLKQFVGNLPANCLSLFGHFVGLVLKGLRDSQMLQILNQSKEILSLTLHVPIPEEEKEIT